MLDEGIAEKYIELTTKSTDDATDDNTDDAAEQTKSIADEVLKGLKAEADGKLFASPKEDKSPWPTLGHFCKSVITGLNDQMLSGWCKDQKITGMGEAINADGGFLIPQEFSTALLTAIAQTGVIAPKCTNFPINNNLSLPFVNRASMATSWTGGVTIYKPSEGNDKTASLPQLAKAELKLNKMTALVYATDELLQDSPIALQTFLTTMVSTEMALTKDEDIINGSGAGEALGVLNSPCLVSVAKVGGQPAASIVTQNVLDMYSRMYAPSLGKAIWLISQDSMPQIGALTLTVGTGGSTVFIADVKNPLGSTLLGRPIIWSPHCQTVGTKGDIYFGDFSQYITATKQGRAMDVATSIHVKFVEDEQAFRFVVRFDGQPWWASAVTPKHGTNTVSPFVALDERA
ncbi:MAG: phage major capsid protein [Flammeovirgaceae bacterium]|nr:phage major capsid protein [Flammeovirgaceae bacterium]